MDIKEEEGTRGGWTLKAVCVLQGLGQSIESWWVSMDTGAAPSPRGRGGLWVADGGSRRAVGGGGGHEATAAAGRGAPPPPVQPLRPRGLQAAPHLLGLSVLPLLPPQ